MAAVPPPGYNPNQFGTYDPNNPQMFSAGMPPIAQAPAASASPYQGMDPKAMAAWMELEAMSPQGDKIKRQLALADKLRGGAPGLLKSQSPINTPNWGGALASVFQNWQAGGMERQADKDMAGYATQRGDIMKRYFGNLRGKDEPAKDFSSIPFSDPAD